MAVSKPGWLDAYGHNLDYFFSLLPLLFTTAAWHIWMAHGWTEGKAFSYVGIRVLKSAQHVLLFVAE